METNFTFDDKTHTYYLGDNRLTGVTTIIGVLAKPQLIAWSARMATEFMGKAITSGEYDLTDKAVLGDLLDEAKSAHTKKKEAAGEHGTDTHALVELYIKECIAHNLGQPRPHSEISPIKAFVDWTLENVDEFLFSERMMFWGDPHYFAGTCDFAYKGKDGKRYIADFKTSSGIYGVDYFLQAAGYKLLAEHAGDEKYDATMIVRMGKDKSFETSVRYETKQDEEAFWACLTLYRAQKSFVKPNN